MEKTDVGLSLKLWGSFTQFLAIYCVVDISRIMNENEKKMFFFIYLFLLFDKFISFEFG